MHRSIGLFAVLAALLLAPQARAQIPAPVGGDMTNTTVKATGATTARKQGDRAADTVTPKDFGAKGDGATDDTAAIQAAINSLGTAGGEVLFPAGKYCVKTGPVTVTKAAIATLLGTNREQASWLDACGAERGDR